MHRLQIHPGHNPMDLIRRQLIELNHGWSETLNSCKDTPDRVPGHDIFHAIEDRLFIDLRFF